MTSAIRPTKKQQELLAFVSAFITEHGYSPSYREIMRGCQYTSVATVALHVRSLIERGHIIKRGRSARSLEVTSASIDTAEDTSAITVSQEKWLVQKIHTLFTEAEEAGSAVSQKAIDELYVLVGSLKVLGLHEPANSFIPRLQRIVATINVEE